MKKKILSVVALALAITVLFCVYYIFREKPERPNIGPDENGYAEFIGKDVTLNLVGKDGETTEFVHTTASDYLQDVMDELDGLEYETVDGMVMSVNGVRADYVLDGAYWAFYVNGGYCNYGIADQPVNDGDIFTIEYTKA